jgi:hypothetical protein
VRRKLYPGPGSDLFEVLSSSSLLEENSDESNGVDADDFLGELWGFLNRDRARGRGGE